MKDEAKTKKQPINEPVDLRQQIAKPEKPETRLKRAGAVAEESSEYAGSIIETLRSPFLALDAELKVLSANSSFYDTFKVTPEKTVGFFIYDLGNRQWNIPRLRTLFEGILTKSTRIDDFEVEHDFPLLGYKVMLLNARRIYREEIDTTMILLSIEDITNRKQAEEELKKHLKKGCLAYEIKTKSDFLTSMSHEMRTPLNAVIGFSEILKQGIPGKLNEKQEMYVDEILTGSKHLLNLINDILDISKIEAGSIELNIEKLSVSQAVHEGLNLVKEKAMERNVLLKVELDPGLEFIEADRLRFKQILFNLLTNAVKFSKEDGGLVTVKTRKEGDMAIFSVSDTGIGIRREDMGKLFKEFKQVSSGISRKYGGTGLGLAISKKLVELHGGKIRAESKYGVGSTFTFSLPIEVKKEVSN